MARIRTTKPELWTDPDFTDVSFPARCLYIAAKNFASDFGVLPDKPKQLKLQCLPADDIDIEPLIEELVGELWERRCAPDGSKVLVIRGFNRHERVDKPNPGRWGNPSTWDPDSGNVPEDSRIVANPPVSSPAEGKGMDGKGKESSSSEIKSKSEAVDNSTDDDSYQQVISLIVDAKERAWSGRIGNPRSWRHRVHMNTHLEDGDQIRSELAVGEDPERVALTVLGYGHDAARERMETAWCASDCAHGCEGDGWTRTDEGFAPCPGRT